jgi:preprotein translocase subunit SecA
LIEAAAKTFDARVQRVLADVERELKANLPDAPNPGQLVRALLNTALGRAVAFDRQHRRMEVAVQRLAYIFLAADMTADWEPAELQEEVLAHLRGAAERLRLLFGRVKHRALTASGAAVNEAPEALGRAEMNNIYRQIMLQVIGGLWVEYLTQVEALRTSIGLEAYAQRDPLVAYKSRATEMFQDLLANIRSGVVSRAFNLRPRVAAPAEAPARAAPTAAPTNGGGAEAPARSEAELVAADAAGLERPQGGGGKRRRRRR